MRLRTSGRVAHGSPAAHAARRAATEPSAASTCLREQAGNGCQCDGSSERDVDPHGCAGITAVGIVFIFSMYSGYIVSAPPRAGSSGSLCFAAASLMNGFAPGR